MAIKKSLPQARQEEIVIQELPDETLIYDLKSHKAHCLNQTSALIWKYCDGQTTAAEMAKLLERDLRTPINQDLVWFTLERLAKARLLKERIVWPHETARLSRREVMRKLGLGAAIAAPLIMTVAAPQSVHAASCVTNCAGRPRGTPCFNAQGNNCTKCCSGPPNNNCIGNCN